MALKLKLIRGRGYESYTKQETEKKYEDQLKEDLTEDMADKEMEENPPVALVTHESNNSHSIFSNDEVYINSQQIYNCNGLYED